MGHEEHQLLIPVVEVHLDRGGETAQQGGQGRLGQVDEAEDLLGLAQLQDAGPRLDRAGLPGQAQGQVPPLAVEKPQGQGQVQGLLVGLTRRRRGVLAHPQLIGPARGVMAAGDGQLRRAGLGVPTPELAQVAAARRLHAGQKVVGGHRLAIVTGEIEVGGAAE